MLAVFLVTETEDGALGSLRWAVNSANAAAGGDTIVFADYLFQSGFNNILVLENGELNITDQVSILGPGAQALTVRQTTAASRVFNVGANSQISGMTISGGNTGGTGGGVNNSANLTMTEVIVTGNSADGGGGGIANSGTLSLQRSLISNNSAQNGGGGIRNQTGGANGTTITNSTITGNVASGGSAYEGGKAYGGGVFNRDGRVTISQSTITLNRASNDGGKGVASWGNPLPDDPADPPPPPTVFTTISTSIVFNNGTPAPGGGAVNTSDVDRVGISDDDPPLDLLPSFSSGGFNMVGTGNAADPASPDVAFESGIDGDQVGVDPLLLPLDDYGGAVPVMLPDFTDPSNLSPAIDAGPGFAGQFEARGRHFARTFDFNGYLAAGGGDPLDFQDPFTAIVDIGAAEVQAGLFIVDTLYDEDDGSYSGIYVLEFEAGEPNFDVGGYTTLGDFSLREAITFSENNPLDDTIRFSETLNSQEILEREDQTPSAPPTIFLEFGQLDVFQGVFGGGQLDVVQSLVIEGPTEFMLEVDASGNDDTQDDDEGNGSRVFVIDNLSASTLANVSISNLTLMGGDQVGRGGGILTRENLTLTHMTLKENAATDDGGAIYAPAGSVTVQESTFNNNRAGDDGGAIFIDTIGAGPQTGAALTNVTFSANFAGDKGGGIYNNNSQVLVSFGTITLNDAGSTRGSGIANAGVNALTSLWATIVSGNASNDVEFVVTPPGATLSSFNSLGHNLIGNGNARNAFNQTGDRINILDPKLAPLLNTGGLIATHRPIYDSNPALTSPAIDMGPTPGPGLPLALPTYDQRGSGFTLDGFKRVEGVRADIGAYEVQRMVLLVSSLFDENDGDLSDGEFSLREAVELSNSNPTLPGSLPDEIRLDPTLEASLPFFTDVAIFLSPQNLLPGTSPDIRITDSLTIVGPGQDLLAISGIGLTPNLSLFPEFSFAGSRMFTIDDGNAANLIDVQITGFTFRDARAPQGGGVFFSRENLTIDDAMFINNHTLDPVEPILLPPVDSTDLHGGALFQQQGTLNISNSTFTGNRTTDALAHGGAVYVLNGTLETFNTTFAGNSTDVSGNGGAIALKNSTFLSNADSITGNVTQGGVGDGGGFYSDNSVVELHDTVVSGNDTVGGNSEGGGFAALNSTITAFDSVISLNTTSGSQSHGGGIFTSGGSLSLTRSIVTQNSTSGAQASGGGLAMVGGTATLDSTSVDRNNVTASGSHGGGVSNVGGNLLIQNSTLYNNQATHSQSKGGGIYSDTNLVVGVGEQKSVILNSTVSGNLAPLRGGGVFNADGLLEIRQSTVSNNSTSTMNTGSGVASQGNAQTRTNVYSSIIAGNVGSAAGTRSDIDFVDGSFINSIESLGFNVIGTGNSLAKFTTGAGDQKSILNPMLGALADNGGLTRTHALLAGSTAIDRGNPSAVAGVSGVPTLDQRGIPFTRVFNGDGIGTARIDVGAYEYQSSDIGAGIAADFDGDDVVDGTDFLMWQRELGTPAPTAVKSDGDADGDKDVDGIDLAVWEATFGGGSENTAVVAMATFSADETDGDQDEEPSFAQIEQDSVPASAAAPVAATLVSDVAAAEPGGADVASGLAGLGVPAARFADARFDNGFVLRKSDRQVRAAIAELVRHTPSLAATSGSEFGPSDCSPLSGDDDGDDVTLEDVIFSAWDHEFLI